MYEQKMIQAMSILVDNAIQKLKFDRSIQAEVFQVVNPELAEYKVKYAGNIFTAYSSDLNYKYKVGDAVWVKVPEGDFSNKKFIENKVSAREVPTGVTEDQIFNMTPPVAEFAPTQDSAAVRSKYAQRDVWFCDGVQLSSFLKIDREFSAYSKGYKNFQIKANFTTKFQQPLPVKGNYGLKVTFTTTDENINPSFTLDKTFFLGDIYNNAVSIEQSGEFSVAEDVVLTGIKSVELFAENFDFDGTDYKDIFLNSFVMTYIDIVDLNNVPYYLKLSTPEGFQGNSIKAQAQLFIQGELLKDDEYEIQWYEQDYSITSSSDKYNKDAGYGWAKIDGATSKQFILERRRYTNVYKAVAYYENNKVTATISVVGTNSETLQLVQYENRLSVQTLDSQTPEADYSYVWYASMPNGSYLQVQGLSKDNYIDIEPYLVYNGIIFYCEVFDDVGLYARLSSAHLEPQDALDGIQVAFIGEEFFNYDANGDIPVEDALRDRTLAVTVDWVEYPEPKKWEIKWVAPDGTELEPLSTLPNSANKYDPDHSQLQQIWVDTNSTFHYSLRQRFSLTNIENTVELKIYDFDNDRTFIFNKTIMFVKDGDIGTNGTTYAARIAYCDASGAVKNHFSGLKYDSGKWSTEYVRVIIYHNGEELTPAAYEDWNLTWEGKNVIIGNGNKATSKGAAAVSITGSGAFYGEHYIRVSAQYKGSVEGNVNLYPHFGVDVYRGSLNTEYLDTTEIPNSIVYSSSGVNPKFYNKALGIKYWNAENATYEDYYTGLGNMTFTSHGTSIIEQKKDNNYYLNPLENISVMEGAMGVYSYTFNGIEVVHTTLLTINTYGNEAINTWDGISVSIDENAGNIFAPQVGAGTKDANNRFTGVVMGQVTDASIGSGSKVYGLYGYNAGENTFYVTEQGNCYLKGKIVSAEGEIGGWAITSNALYSTKDTARPGNATPSPNDKNIRFQSDGTFNRNLLDGKERPTNLKFAIGDKFAVDEDGVLYSGGAVIRASKLSITVDNAGQAEDKTVNDFIQDYYDSNIKEKLDDKIETYYNVTDPSVNWMNEEDKKSHIGDIWTNPDKVDESGKVIENGFTKIWNGSSWEDTTATPPGLLIDKWDGKKTVFNSQPVPPYYLNDLWIHGDGAGDIKYCVNEKPNVEDVFSSDDWKKADGYADDVEVRSYIDGEIFNLQKQLDGKIQTFYQETDPSAGQSWGEDHTGDLWYNPNTKKTQRWNGKNWEEYNGALPQDLFDKTDGNRQIVYTNNENELPPVPYEIGDFWLPGLNSSLRVCITPKNANETASKDDWSIYSYYANKSDITNATTALDNSINQAEILSRLTGGHEEGLYFSETDPNEPGKKHLLINSSFIESGTLSAGIIRTTKDPTSPNYQNDTFYVNLETGEVRIKAKSLSITGGDGTTYYDVDDKFNNLSDQIADSSPIQIVLTNEYQGIPCNNDGIPLNGALPVTTEVRVFFGTQEVTSSSTITITQDSGITADQPTRTSVRITALTNDFTRGAVHVHVKYGVFPEVTRDFTVNKVKNGANGADGKQGEDGQPGAPGEDATFYLLETSLDIVRKDAFSMPDPDLLSMYGYLKTGNKEKTPISAYFRVSCFNTEFQQWYFFWESDAAGEKFDLIFSEHTQDLAQKVLLSGTNQIRVVMCSKLPPLDGKIDTLSIEDPEVYDIKTLPYLADGKDGKDGSEITDEEFFNKLTNNGQLEGFFVDTNEKGESQAFVNASYVRSGTLVLGGLDNKDGLLQIRDASDKQIGYWDNTGLHVLQGSIEGTNIKIGGSQIQEGGPFSYGAIEVYGTNLLGEYGRSGYWDGTGLNLTEFGVLNIFGKSDSAVGPYIPQLQITTSSIFFSGYNTTLSLPNPHLAGIVFSDAVEGFSSRNSILMTAEGHASMGVGSAPSDYYIDVSSDGTIKIKGTLQISGGQKYRAVKTPNYGVRLLSAMESPTPVFSDIGSATCDENGIAFISIDPMFAETIESGCVYKVFFTQTNELNVYRVGEKQDDYFTVVGEPGATLDWIIYAPQKGYQNERLEETELPKQEERTNQS